MHTDPVLTSVVVSLLALNTALGFVNCVVGIRLLQLANWQATRTEGSPE